LTIATLRAEETPPPGVGLLTVMAAVPVAARSAAASWTVSVVAETYVVGRTVPLSKACELAMKPVPLSVSMAPALPATSEDGETEVNAGTGLGAAVMLKAAEVETLEALF
jgi:hypothetical protein